MVASLALAISRRTLAWLAVGGSLVALGWVFFGDSDEAKILARLEELANAVETKPDENMAFARCA